MTDEAARKRALEAAYDAVRAVLDRSDTSAPEFEALDDLYCWSLDGLGLRNEQAEQNAALQQMNRRHLSDSQKILARWLGAEVDERPGSDASGEQP